ncbi:MAG: 50S ribosomal protein L4 [Acidobacteria bacterium]|nr:50S ribosomal protein L4 [Acidobacteriota bacterium]
MPTVEVKDSKNQKVGSVDLPGEVFAYPFKEHLVHEAVRNYRASLRAGTHKTKVRSEVAGSGKKPFKQKGTGRARQGGARPPIHRHGGTVFGPVPRDYSYKMNVREKKAALKAALSRKLRDKLLMVVDAFELEQPKTKLLADRIAALGVDGKVLLVDSAENVNLHLASRNHPKLQMADPLHVNVYDVVNNRYIVITQASLQKLLEVLQG